VGLNPTSLFKKGVTVEELEEKKKPGRKPKTFAEFEGTPAIQQAKENAKNSKTKEKSPEKEFYTIKDGKYVKMIVKKKGAYSIYMGRAGKLPGEKAQIQLWKKDGVWVNEHDCDDVCSEFINSLK
jgi:hypothetical protein